MATLEIPLLVNTSVIFSAFVGPRAGPFYFAWTNSDDFTFGPQHLRMDEYIFSVSRTLAEGQKPLLELEIKNPRIGLLNAAREAWAWFSYDDGSGPVPLFFGRLVAAPMQSFDEIIIIHLISDPVDYKIQKQALAESLKVLPYYDPVFLPQNLRDDPDKILETYASFWEVDPVTHVVQIVSFVDGSDGNIDLDEDDHFYDGMNITVSQPPTTIIQMDATVQWTQTSRGVAGSLNHAHIGLTDTIRTSWPKSNTQIGDGWSVLESAAIDILKADDATTQSISYTWQNTSKHEHANGDHMSSSYSATSVAGGFPFISFPTSYIYQSGFGDPYAVDDEGDPAPINIPLVFSSTGIAVLSRGSSCTMTLQYDAARARTERVVFRIKADTQAILVDPDIDQESELIVLNGADVGVPLLDVLTWTSVAGQPVALGQIIFPDDPQMPGGRTTQICVVAGTAGNVPPDFSDIPGFETIDGTVTWSSLGAANLDTYADWAPNQHYNAGTTIVPSRSSVITYVQLQEPYAQLFPPVGATVSSGLVIQASNLSYHRCIAGGVTSKSEPVFSATYGTIVSDGDVQWFALGPILPTGMAMHICTQSGLSGEFPPLFNAEPGGETTDNTVTWVNVGATGGGEIPIGGIPGEVNAPSYFTTTRGHQSIEFLALLVRARHLWRCRCIDMSFDVAWNTGLDITTRKTITLHDPRLPGGLAVGKVKSAVMSFSDSGEAICRVSIGCLVGKDNAVSASAGTPDYVDEGYVDEGYQKYSNVFTLLPTGSDLNYAPPTYTPTDDGLTFPLTLDQALVRQETGGGAIDAVLLNQVANSARKSVSGTFGSSSLSQRGEFNTTSQPPAQATNPMMEAAWVEFELKPVNAGPFHSVVFVKFSDLTMTRGIDLEGAAT